MIGVISVTEKGNKIAEKINEKLNGKVFFKSRENLDLKNVTKDFMENLEGIIFISSTGIAIRLTAPYLKGKSKDPAIVVVDVNNNFTISLLSGHLGGANELTLKVSSILNNTPVITTATDGMNLEAPDMIAKNNNLIIDNLNVCKNIASLLVNGNKVYFKDDKELIKLPKGYIKTREVKNNTLWITNKLDNKNEDNTLRLLRKDVILGIGCRKDTDSNKLKKFVLKTLKENNYDERAVKIIGSIDVKKNEQAIIDLAKYFNCEFKTFNKDEINSVDCDYEESDFVFKTVGVKGVCEPVVHLLGGEVTLKKTKYEGMTLSIGEEIVNKKGE
ncbi:cobalt-precorrin 5A hydrolase [Clostridium moniliforme]|uniref:Cobalt-precorrin 5A hydrolase n=1 Tax=Clostridium moniliforme TaxID=39489 RepID=A0ABS4F038_9CLOT|nr:cobalt-precorrin 5A hydrolase [Clostridium moniliforme]MBP1889617.1 cobalt-precorrin 5A hydrolase [Clostridium moniliforme]